MAANPKVLMASILMLTIPPMTIALLDIQKQNFNTQRTDIQNEYRCIGTSCIGKIEFKKTGFLSSESYKGLSRDEVLNILNTPEVQENPNYTDAIAIQDQLAMLGIVLGLFFWGLPKLLFKNKD